MSSVQEHALPVEYVTVVTTLFGYGTMRYDAEDGAPIEYGRVDYRSEGEALAEAQGWAAADDIPLDKHALRLTRAAISAAHTAQSSETLVGELMSDLRDAMQQASEPEPTEGRGNDADDIRPIERSAYDRVHAAIRAHDWPLVATLASQSSTEDLATPSARPPLLVVIANEVPTLFEVDGYAKALNAMAVRCDVSEVDSRGLTALDVARSARNWACFDRLFAESSRPALVQGEGDANASPATDATVTAVIRSDRRTVDATFDASHWLAAASDEAIQSLALSDWTGEPADSLAYFEEGRGEESVIAVLCWCGKSMDLPQDMHEGFTVAVDEGEAMAWLERHRPAVKTAIDALPRSTTVGASVSGGLSP